MFKITLKPYVFLCTIMLGFFLNPVIGESTKVPSSCLKKELSEIVSCSEVELKAIKKRFDECWKNLSGTAGYVGGDCVFAEYQETAKVLDNLYDALLEKATLEYKSEMEMPSYGEHGASFKSGLAALKEMHILWKQLLKPTCKYETRESYQGTAYGLYEYRCLTKHTRRRIKYYQDLYYCYDCQ